MMEEAQEPVVAAPKPDDKPVDVTDVGSGDQQQAAVAEPKKKRAREAKPKPQAPSTEEGRPKRERRTVEHYVPPAPAVGKFSDQPKQVGKGRGHRSRVVARHGKAHSKTALPCCPHDQRGRRAEGHARSHPRANNTGHRHPCNAPGFCRARAPSWPTSRTVSQARSLEIVVCVAPAPAQPARPCAVQRWVHAPAWGRGPAAGREMRQQPCRSLVHPSKTLGVSTKHGQTRVAVSNAANPLIHHS